MAKARKRRKNRGGRFLALLLLAAVFIAAYMYVFRVRTLLVEGVDSSQYDHVKNLSGITMGESMFSLSESRLRMNLSADPYLEYISVRKEYPSTVAITMRERQAAGAIAYSGIYLLVDDEGRILETTPALPQGMPAVTSVRVSSANIGTKLTSSQSDQAGIVLAIISELKAQDALSLIRQIDVGDRNSLYLVTFGDIKVVLGDETSLPDKIAWMRATLEEMARLGYSGGRIDVSSGKNAVYAPTEN